MKWARVLLMIALTISVALPAWSQGMPSMAPQRPEKPKKPAAPDPNVPQTHAASGAESLLPPSSEPSLPDDPLAIPEDLLERIGSDAIEDDIAPTTEPVKRTFYGLYYSEERPGYQLRALFPPLWIERLKYSLNDPGVVDRASLFGLFYYNRRSPTISHDILFPIFWNLNDEGGRTTIIGPLVNRSAPDETDNWLAPLYFTGTRKHGGYTIIPPLLTYTNADEKGGFNLVALGYCSWTGGENCDTRTATDIDFGIAPFFFYGQNDDSRYEVIPPLLHYYSYDDKTASYTNVWGPYFRRHTPKRDMLHLLPIYWSIWGENERHTTIAPLFHYGWKGEKENLLITPLFLNRNGPDGEHTFATWLYARHRGRTELDMITPFYWSYRDPTIGLTENLLFPFLYTKNSPRESTAAFFPLWAHSERFGVSKTTWITPLFRHKTGLEGSSTNIYPLFFFGSDGDSAHNVVAPIFWDFKEGDSRTTIGFPLFWRFAEKDELSQLVGNSYYHERKVPGGLDWEFHFFPVFSYGETPDGHWWNVLYGFTGYTRRGARTEARALWIPFEISGPAE